MKTNILSSVLLPRFRRVWPLAFVAALVIGIPCQQALAQPEKTKTTEQTVSVADQPSFFNLDFPYWLSERMKEVTPKRIGDPNAITGVSTWNGGTGNWSDGSMWNAAGAPNDGTADVIVDGGNATNSVVTVDGTFTVGRLTIDAGDSVVVGNNVDFRVANGAFMGSGSIVNNGSMSLNATGNTTRLLLTGGAGVTLSGTGTFTMGVGSNQISGDTFNAVFTNQSTIQGAGNIGVNIIDVNNQSLIDANLAFTGSNSLYLDANGTFTNSGTLRASNGGLLQLGAASYANTGGTILATGMGSVAQLESNAVVSGGTLSTASGGLVQSASGATVTLTNVSNTGNYQATNNSDTYLTGTMTNSGTITLVPTGNATRLMLTTGGAILTGGGNVILGGASAQISGNTFNALLTNAANTISGVGNIGVNIIDVNNQSLIDANVPFTGSNLLVLDPNATLTNTGTLRASNGGVLDLGGGSYANANGMILATGTGSVVQLDNSSSVSGGTLATSAGGLIRTVSGITTTLDSINSTGSFEVTNNSTTRLMGTISNSGTMTLRASGNNAILNLTGAAGTITTLTGGGNITLNDTLGTGNQIKGENFSEVLLNQNNTISGVGNIGVNIIDINNQGLIDANVAYAVASHFLLLDPTTTLTNTGTLRASNGGLLDLGGGAYANAGGTILATGTNSIVQLDNGANVSGGTLATSGGGVIQTATGISVGLDNISNTGTYQALNNSDTRISGTINNSGTMTLNASGNAVRLIVPGAAGSNTILAGGGSIILSDALGTNNQITGDNFGNILTNQNQTISGIGNIGVNVLDINNQSLIDANVPYSVASHLLLLDPTSTLTNTGTLRASNGGFMDLGGGTYANTGGMILATGAGSIVQLDNQSIVNGGTLATGSGGVIQTGSGISTTLDSVSNTGTYQALNNSDTRILGTINNSGTMTLRASGNAVRFIVPGAAGSNTTLSGGGRVVLEDSLGTNNQITGDNAGNILTNQDNTISGAGNIGENVLNLVNGGVIEADRTNNLVIDPAATFLNNAGGILRGSGSGGLFLAGGAYTNNGTFEALNGGSVFMNTDASLTNNVGGVLTGGIYRAIASGSGATLTIRGSNITQIATDTEVDLSGAGSILQNNTTAIESTLLSNAGNLRILANRDYANTNALSDSGVIELGGGIISAPTFTISSTGEFFGFGTSSIRPDNSGLVRAFGGTLSLTGGVGSTGTVQIDPTGLLRIGAASSADFLTHNGSAAGSLNLGAFNFVVNGDYTNANFGAGNSFNPRANVTGTGLLMASGDVAQTLSGAVTNGASASPLMAFGNVHVGDSPSLNFQVNNTGSSGPVLRGALQTSVNGGNITDGRLIGTGVTPSNFGPLVLGGNTGALGVTFNATSAGALVGQVLHVINNFDNVIDPNMSITGAAYRYANPTMHSPEPVAFGNFHVGAMAPSQSISLTNNVPNDMFSEALDGMIGSPTGGVTTNGGSFSLLAPGATNTLGSLSVGIDTSTAGSKNGTATITLQSDGTGSSGLGITNLASQIVNITGSVFRYAAPSVHMPEPIVLPNQHVGDSLTQALSFTNNAVNDNFSEKLGASFINATGSATASGSFGLLAAGATDNSSLLVGVDTSMAGARGGTVTVGLVSNGLGTSGLGTTSLGSQIVNVSGNVYRLASASPHTPEPVDFGVHHVGESVSSIAVSVTNNATNDAFSESLNGGISTTGTGLTASGGFAGLAPSQSSTALSVGISTMSAGSRNGTATIALQSNGAGSSGLGLTNLASQTVNVTGQVNYYADPVLIFKMGSATLTMNGPNSFTLNFGQVAQNSGSYMASFGVQNFLHDLTYQDSLGGAFNTAGVTNFGTSGVGTFSNIVPGGSLDPTVTFDSTQGPGSYSNLVSLTPTSTNASGTSNLGSIQLTLAGQIVVVPEPSTWMLIFGGAGLMAVSQKRWLRR